MNKHKKKRKEKKKGGIKLTKPSSGCPSPSIEDTFIKSGFLSSKIPSPGFSACAKRYTTLPKVIFMYITEIYIT